MASAGVQLYTGELSDNQTSAETPGERQHSDHQWQADKKWRAGANLYVLTRDRGDLWRQNVFILHAKEVK